MAKADQVILAFADLKGVGVTVPAHHTADYYDANGNVFAEFGHPPLDYDKRCKLDHWEDHDIAFPITVKFTEHEPPPSRATLDDDWAPVAAGSAT